MNEIKILGKMDSLLELDLSENPVMEEHKNRTRLLTELMVEGNEYPKTNSVRAITAFYDLQANT